MGSTLTDKKVGNIQKSKNNTGRVSARQIAAAILAAEGIAVTKKNLAQLVDHHTATTTIATAITTGKMTVAEFDAKLSRR